MKACIYNAPGALDCKGGFGGAGATKRMLYSCGELKSNGRNEKTRIGQKENRRAGHEKLEIELARAAGKKAHRQQVRSERWRNESAARSRRSSKAGRSLSECNLRADS